MAEITRKSFRFAKHPEEEQLDVFAHLDRFSLDSVQFSSRQFRFVVETLMATVCLRVLRNVEMHPGEDMNQKRRSLDVFEGRCDQAAKVQKGYVVGWSFQRPINVPGSLTALESTERRVLFRSEDEAGLFLLGLMQSSTIGKLTLGRFTPDAEIVRKLAAIAPSVRVQSLVALVGTCLPQSVLLHFSGTDIRTLKTHQQSGRMPDETLEVISDKTTSSLRCEPCDSQPLTASTSDVSDVGIQEFLLQPSEESVVLHLSQSRVSSTFCTDLFKMVLSSSTRNELSLEIEHNMHAVDQDLSAILKHRRSSTSPEACWFEAFSEYHRDDVFLSVSASPTIDAGCMVTVTLENVSAGMSPS